MAALVALVLGAHLVVLADGLGGSLSLPSADDAIVTPVHAALPTTTRADQHNRQTPDAQRAPVVRVSTVRWIVPTPPVVASAERAPAPATAVAPALAPKPKPAPRPAAPSLIEPVKTVEPAPAMPPAPELVAAAAPIEPLPMETVTEPYLPAPEAIAVQQEVALVQPVAHAQPTPAPAPTASDVKTTEARDETAPADEEDTLLAAAGASKPRNTASTATAKLPPAQVPASMRLQYDVAGNIKGIGYKAEGLLDWSVANGRYDARLEMRVMLLGSRSQTSTGRVGPQGLMPERFADKSRSEKATHFDAAQQRIRFSNNAPEAPLQPGAQDRLSLFMQLAGLLQARPQAYGAGQVVNMQVAGTGDAPVWRFEVGEESTLRVPAGEFRVRHVVRQPRKEFDSTVEMWLAPSMGHMPVRLRITQPNGDVADQKLRQMP